MQSLQSAIIKVLTFQGHLILNAVGIAKIKTISVSLGNEHTALSLGWALSQ